MRASTEPNPSNHSKIVNPAFNLPPVAYLLGASALWGTYPSTIKSLFACEGAAINPEEVTLIRFLLMALIGVSSFAAADVAISPVAAASSPLPEVGWREQLSRRVPSSVYVAAFELGAIGLCGTLFNTYGISKIPALQGAVLLTFLNVVTPFISVAAGATEEEVS